MRFMLEGIIFEVRVVLYILDESSLSERYPVRLPLFLASIGRDVYFLSAMPMINFSNLVNLSQLDIVIGLIIHWNLLDNLQWLTNYYSSHCKAKPSDIE